MRAISCPCTNWTPWIIYINIGKGYVQTIDKFHKISQNFTILEFRDYIWNHHEKCILMSTNIPSIGSVISQIGSDFWEKKKTPFKNVNFPMLSSVDSTDYSFPQYIALYQFSRVYTLFTKTLYWHWNQIHFCLIPGVQKKGVLNLFRKKMK